MTWEAYNYDEIDTGLKLEVTLPVARPGSQSMTAHHHHHGHNPALLHHFATEEQQKDSAELGMWIFLATEVMFFGGLSAPT